jgi:hypothetical protein
MALLMSLIKAVDSAVFKADTYKKGGSENLPKSTIVGKWLREKGHKLEEVYVDSLGGGYKQLILKNMKGKMFTIKLVNYMMMPIKFTQES